MARLLNEIDMVLSIYNQENLIERILYGIFKNTTTSFTLILVFDGCTDRTEPRALKYIKRYKPSLLKNLIVEHAKNVFETRANNIGFKLAKHDYMITLQDDMVINEYGWERRLTFPLRRFDDVIAVSSRVAQDIGLMENLEQQKYFINQVGRELNNLPRNIFAVKDTINRGPVAFNMKHLRSMNYLNDKYAPSDLDDADLCLRAWEKNKLRCGAYWIDYISRREWGKARAKDSTMLANNTIGKNAIQLKRDHLDYINSRKKHDEEIIIKENEVDYIKNSSPRTVKNMFIYPIRITYKDIIRFIKGNIKK